MMSNQPEVGTELGTGLGAAPPALDPEVLAGLWELVDDEDDSFVRDLYSAFFTTFRNCSRAMHRAIGDGDAAVLQRNAHTLKGAAANVGAVQVASLSRSLQEMGDTGSVEGAAQIMEQLEAELSRVREAVEASVPGCVVS